MKERSFIHEFIAGNVGGIVGIGAVYPLDTIKIRIQTYPGLYKSSFDVLHQMHQKSGVLSMYRGLLAPCAGFGLTFAISFSSFGYFSKCFKEYRNKSSNNTIDLIYAGALTGLVQSPPRAIMERIKSVMQVHEKKNNSTPFKWSGECFMYILRHQGISGLFQGFSSVLLREIPQFAVYYPTYYIAKDKFINWGLSNTLSELVAGGVAGVIQWLPPLYNIDVIKSHMQTCEPGKYKGFVDCSRQLYKTEGSTVFFRGCQPALVRAFCLHSIIFYMYETTMRYLEAV